MNAPTHLSLFTGIGGIDLAAEWAGFETVGQCEWADYPTKVLEKHWPDVPRWRDIRTLTKEDFYARTGRRTVDLISGGFPCQPFSVAGNQKGKEDERYLWPEMLRVIRELAPRWVIGENVPGILHIAAADVVKDLERLGYHVVVFAFEAAAVGARHRRERLFFVANANIVSDGREGNVCDVRGIKNGDARQRKDVESCQSSEIRTAISNSEHDGRATAEVAGSVGTRSDTDQTGEKSTIEPAGRCECGRRKRDVANTTCERCGKAWEHSQRSEERSSGGGNVPDTSGAGSQGRKHEGAYFKVAARGEERTHGTASKRGDDDASNTDHAGLQIAGQQPGIEKISASDGIKLGDWWSVEPDVGRVAHGVSSRVDRLKCLGNAVVPQQVYPICRAIYEILRGDDVAAHNS